jgi:hypothetical protein
MSVEIPANIRLRYKEGQSSVQSSLYLIMALTQLGLDI